MSAPNQFTTDFLDRLRDRINIVELISTDISLKRAGHSYVACCPFHKEKTPSFSVSDSRGRYRCFGCHANGDVISWMMAFHHFSFRDAVEHLARMAGIEVPRQDRPADDDGRRGRQHALHQALDKALYLYRKGLAKNERASSYARADRQLNEQTIALFEIGAVSSGVAPFLQKSISDDDLVSAGIAARRENGSLYDRLRYRLIFPIRNERGSLIGFAGRELTDSAGKYPKYMNSPETELFRKGNELFGLFLAKTALRTHRTAIVVEGYFDVVVLRQEGEARAVAPMGTAITARQLEKLYRTVDTVAFVFDGDRAGRKAALSAAAQVLDVMADDHSATFALLPAGHDPDTYVREHGIEAWRALVDGAEPLSVFLVNCLTRRYDLTVAESQVQAARKGAAMLARIKRAPMFRKALQLSLEKAIGLTLEGVSDGVES